MTSRELREYEQGKAYGYSHPRKVNGWFKSTAWNNGLKAGKAEYWRDCKKWQKRARALARIERRFRKARDGDVE